MDIEEECAPLKAAADMKSYCASDDEAMISEGIDKYDNINESSEINAMQAKE